MKAILSQALEALEDPTKLVPHNGQWTSIKSIAIASLRAALAEGEAEQKPVAIQARCRQEAHPDGWYSWENCSEQSYNDYLKTPLRHGWLYEVRKLYTHPSPAALRAAVIEECAQICESPDRELELGKSCAVAVRALKEKV